MLEKDAKKRKESKDLIYWKQEKSNQNNQPCKYLILIY